MRGVIAAVLLIPLLIMGVCAQGDDSGSTDARLYTADEFGVESIMDALPEEVRHELPDDNIYSSDALINKFGPEYFLELVRKTVKSALSPALKTLSSVLGLLVVVSALSALKASFNSGAIKTVFSMASGLCVILSLYGTVSRIAYTAGEYLSRLATLVGAAVPVTVAISTAGGNIGAAAVSANGMMLGLAFVEIMASEMLFPIIRLCFGLCAASGISTPVRLGGISKTVRDVVTFVFAVIGALISAVMTFQTSIASRADSLSMRAVKFAASHTVPVVGGIAGDAVGAVAESLSLIKGSVGWAGVVLIIILTVPIIAQVLLTRLGITLSVTVADILGLDHERALLTEINGILGFIAAVCVIAAIMFIYAMALFASAASALG